jgi:hypothetical protein
MLLFTATIRSSWTAGQKDRLSRAVHAASIIDGYPEDDLCLLRRRTRKSRSKRITS